jgi:hypothetical protein
MQRNELTRLSNDLSSGLPHGFTLVGVPNGFTNLIDQGSEDVTAAFMIDQRLTAFTRPGLPIPIEPLMKIHCPFEHLITQAILKTQLPLVDPCRKQFANHERTT